MRLLLHLAFFSIVNTGCHALEKNLNQQVPWPSYLFSDPSEVFKDNPEQGYQAESAQGLINDRNPELMTNANMKHSSIINSRNPLKRNRKYFENSSTSSSSYQHAGSEPSLQANWHDVSHHQGFLYSNYGQVTSTVSSNPNEASINAISPKYPFVTPWNPSKNTHHESLSPYDQVSSRDIFNMTPVDHRNVNSRDKEVLLSFFESPSHQGSQDRLEKYVAWLSSVEPISDSNAQVDSSIPPGEKKSSSSDPSSMLVDELRTLSETPDLPNEKNSETARSAEAPIPNSFQAPKKSNKSNPTRLRKAEGFKGHSTAFQWPFLTKQTDFQHIFEFCDLKPNTLNDYFDETYKYVVSAYLHNFSDWKAPDIFFTYLLFVEMINEISPRYNVADGGIQSACQSFITQYQNLQRQYLELAKDSNPRKDQSIVEKVDLLWCYLEGWMTAHRSSLIDQFATAENPGFLPDDFKSFLNHIFVLKFGKLGKKYNQSSRCYSHLEKYISDHDSQGPSDENDVSLPILSQPLTSLSSSTTELERKNSNLSRPSPIKFFEKDLALNSHGTHWDPLLSTLRKEKRFPLVLDDGDAIQSLVRLIDERKHSTNGNDRKKPAKAKNKTKVDVYRYSLFNQAGNFYRRNIKTWFRYFDQRYNLHTELYHQDLNHQPSKFIFPVYLFYVEMINQIVRGDNSENGGMLSACYYFEKLLKLYTNPESTEENQKLWKFIDSKVGNYSRQTSRTLMWGYVEYWLMQDRPELSQKLTIRKSNVELQRNVKGLFNEIFFVSCVELTQNLKGERISLNSQTAPDLFQLHNYSQRGKNVSKLMI